MKRRREILTGWGGGIVTGIAGMYWFTNEFWIEDARRKAYAEGEDEGIKRVGGFEPTTNDTKIHSTDNTRSIQPDSHHHYSLTIPDSEALLTVVGLAQGHLDWLLMSNSDYEAYDSDGGNPQVMTLFSRMDTSRAIVKRVLDPGEYEFVVDNTGHGRGDPTNTPTDYGIKIEAYQR